MIYALPAAPPSDGFPDKLTAAGTLAAAGVALVVAIWSIWWAHHERKRSERREQRAEAYSVQVVLAKESVQEDDEPVNDYGDPVGTKMRLVGLVLNRGAYTISGLDGGFVLSNRSEIRPERTEWLSGFDGLPEGRRRGLRGMPAGGSRASCLAPWDGGLRFESAVMEAADAEGALPVTRWADKWGDRWEHQNGATDRAKKTPKR